MTGVLDFILTGNVVMECPKIPTLAQTARMEHPAGSCGVQSVIC